MLLVAVAIWKTPPFSLRTFFDPSLAYTPPFSPASAWPDCPVNNATDTEAFDFTACHVNLIDERATVKDLCNNHVTTVLASNAPVTQSETCVVGPFPDCGEYVVTNTVTLTPNDRPQLVDSATCTTTATATRENYSIQVSKTADPALTRTYGWYVTAGGLENRVGLVLFEIPSVVASWS